MFKKICGFLSIIILLVIVQSVQADTIKRGYVNNGYMMIPLRGVLEELGADIQWDPLQKGIFISLGDTSVKLEMGKKTADVNGQMINIDAPPVVKNGNTYVPLRFVAQTIGAEVNWDKSTSTATVLMNGIMVQVKEAKQGNVKEYVKSVAVNGKSIKATIIEIPPNTLRPDVALAKQRVGGTEALASIAKQNKAIAAINGTFFEAYGGVPDPWGTLIKDGQVAHIGNIGTAIGFTTSGGVKMDTLRIRVNGSVSGDKGTKSWYAYGFNRTPGSSGGAYMFTLDRGQSLGFAKGISVVVVGGSVQNIVSGQDVRIPEGGYVLNFSGGEQYLAGRFSVGDRVDCAVEYTNKDGTIIDWSDVTTAVGAGPRLVKDGKLAVDPAGEGFVSQKILTGGGARSAIGIKTDGTVLLVAVPGATIMQLAVLMKSLGSCQAMNLDGGASSGLIFKGSCMISPGRAISNALIFR